MTDNILQSNNPSQKTLSKYLNENPTQKVISIAPYDSTKKMLDGVTIGYFVIVEQKVETNERRYV